MTIFNANEVFEIAVKIEENGERFYRTLAENVEDETLKNLFKQLGEAEVKHKEFFQNLQTTFRF